MMLTHELEKLIQKEDLQEKIFNIMEEIFQETNPCQIAAFLTLLRAKGETSEELFQLVNYLQSRMTPLLVNSEVIDIVGTGGDKKKSVNISTAASILAASSGCKIIKHGNSSSSSASGSADVLFKLGIDIYMSPEKAAQCFEKIGICFCFAPYYHPILAKVKEIRKALGIPTCFNLVCPLLNPARPNYLLIGVYHESLIPIIAEVLKAQKVKKAWVFHCSGYDEITTLKQTKGIEVTLGAMKPFVIDPEKLGFSKGKEEELKGGNAEENAKRILEVFSGSKGTLSDTILLNAAAALYVSGKSASVEEGITIARASLQQGKALEFLNQWRELC